MSAITIVGEHAHIADYLAPSVLFAEYEHRQHWGSLSGNYVVDGRNFVVQDARVDYEPEYIAESPVPEPATWLLVAFAIACARVLLRQGWRARL